MLGLSLSNPDSSPETELVLAAGLAKFGALWAFFAHLGVHWRFGPLEWRLTTHAFHH